MSEQPPTRRTIHATHRHVSVGIEGLREQDATQRRLDALHLAQRVEAAAARPDPVPATPPPSPPTAPSSSPPSAPVRPGAIVVDVAAVKAASEARAARRADLERIEAAIDTALRQGLTRF